MLLHTAHNLFRRNTMSWLPQFMQPQEVIRKVTRGVQLSF